MKPIVSNTTTECSLNFYLGISFIIIIPEYIAFKLINGVQHRRALEGKLIRAKAVIINDKNFTGNSPVSQQFSYSYSFRVKGREYKHNSRNPSLQLGDSISIEYVPDDPAISRPIDE